jgi:hypothetical protein
MADMVGSGGVPLVHSASCSFEYFQSTPKHPPKHWIHIIQLVICVLSSLRLLPDSEVLISNAKAGVPPSHPLSLFLPAFHFLQARWLLQNPTDMRGSYRYVLVPLNVHEKFDTR